MLSQKINDALNTQIKAEFYASYLYLSMSAYCDSIGLTGLAHWMRHQSEEDESDGDRNPDATPHRRPPGGLQRWDRPSCVDDVASDNMMLRVLMPRPVVAQLLEQIDAHRSTPKDRRSLTNPLSAWVCTVDRERPSTSPTSAKVQSKQYTNITATR